MGLDQKFLFFLCFYMFLYSLCPFPVVRSNVQLLMDKVQVVIALEEELFVGYFWVFRGEEGLNRFLFVDIFCL